jgi:2-oxoglutarate dehydrogenase complex dehydrogenase (E1) component-like enzyme
MYKRIAQQPTVVPLYGKRLIEEGVISEAEFDAMKAAYRSETGSFEPGMFRDTEFRKAVTPQLSTELDALTKLIEGKKTAEVDVTQAKLRSARESREQKLRTGSQAARREIEKGLKIDKSAARRVRRYLGR